MAELGLDPQVKSIVLYIIWIKFEIEIIGFGPLPISLNFRSACSASPSCSACATRSLSLSGRAATVCTNTFPTGQSTKSSRICLEGGIAVILCHYL